MNKPFGSKYGIPGTKAYERNRYNRKVALPRMHAKAQARLAKLDDFDRGMLKLEIWLMCQASARAFDSDTSKNN